MAEKVSPSLGAPSNGGYQNGIGSKYFSIRARCVAGAAALGTDAPESTRGFLLNHLITELLPEREGGYRFSNSDPITGQAAWYDLRVSIEKAAPGEAHETSPRFEPLKVSPGKELVS